jgi:hypothetical protein
MNKKSEVTQILPSMNKKKKKQKVKSKKPGDRHTFFPSSTSLSASDSSALRFFSSAAFSLASACFFASRK